MSNPEILRANERYKALSNVGMNLGSALFGAGVVSIYATRGVGVEGLVWLLVGAGLIWFGWKLLGLLESED